MSSLALAPLKKSFRKDLLNWNKTKNKREMPWKGEKDPYKIWLSEIILQQTRVQQGLEYYNRFIETFPGIQNLASAKDAQVFKLWEGLGYYSRCSNLLDTARIITKEKKAKFPESYEDLKKLKGIGTYTAAAISSFAFNKPHAVVDGNVFRVLSRVFGIEKAIDSTDGKKFFSTLANELIDKKNPGTYNQAIMDFGAVVCKPAPECNACIFQKKCFAFLNNKIAGLPIKQKKQSIKKRWLYYLVLMHKGKVAIRQRAQKDIWKQLYEFPMIEAPGPMNQASIIREAGKRVYFKNGKFKVNGELFSSKQQLSHQLIQAGFIQLQINEKPLISEWIWVRPATLHAYSFPRVIRRYILSVF
jgi:A/G-specific adenine glycosylase